VLKSNPEKQFVCLTALPGAGKTTLCNNLNKEGDYEYFCRDQEMEKIPEELGKDFMKKLNDKSDAFKRNYGRFSVFKDYIDGYNINISQNSGYIKKIRLRIESDFRAFTADLQKVNPIILKYATEVREFMITENFPEISDDFILFSKWLDRILEVQSNPIKFFEITNNIFLRNLLVSQLAIKRTTERAIESFKEDQKNILLDNHSFFQEKTRDFWRQLIAEKTSSDPILLILQTTRQTLIDVAHKRNGVDGPRSDEVEKLISKVESIGPEETEEWKGLVIQIFREIDTNVLEVRSKIEHVLDNTNASKKAIKYVC